MIIWTLKQETQVERTWYEISHEPHFQNTMISRRSHLDFNESVQLTLLLSSTLMKYVKIYVHITYVYIYIYHPYIINKRRGTLLENY